MTTAARQVRVILANDLKLLLRSFWRKKWSATILLVVLAAGLLLTHGLSIFLFLHTEGGLTPHVEAVAWAFFASFMLGSAMTHAITLLFERNDFDLLLSSPIPPRTVLVARMTTIAVGAALSVAFFLLPLLNGVIVGRSRAYLAGYATWFLLALACASAGTLATLTLVRWLGARRARTAVQVVGAVFGASVYLSFQLPHFLGPEQRDAVWNAARAFLSSPAATVVLRSAQGSIADLGWVFAASLLLCIAVARLLDRTFIAGIQDSGDRKARRTSSRRFTFRSGVFRATFHKEVRLILRDPLLLSQVLPSILYILPALFGARALGSWAVLAPLSVLVLVQFSLMLTTVAVGGEEGLDLIRSSPLPEIRLRVAKLAAAMVLPTALAAVLCVIVASTGRPWLAMVTFITAFVTAAGCCWLRASHVTPSPRADILKAGGRRFSIWNLVTGVIMMLSVSGIGVLAGGYSVLLALLLLGVTGLALLACFVFVTPKEIADDP